MKIDISKILNVNANENIIEFFRLIDSDDIVSIKVYKNLESMYYKYIHEGTEVLIEKVVGSILCGIKKKNVLVLVEKSGFYCTDYAGGINISQYFTKEDLSKYYRITDDNKVLYTELHINENHYQFSTPEEAISVATKLTDVIKKDFITIE
jgi:hypothetical protein